MLGALILHFERFGRGPSDQVFVGTWQVGHPDTSGESYWHYSFRSDHTYEMFFTISPGDHPFVGETGTWFAGGEFIYLRSPSEDLSYSPVRPFHIDALSADEARLHHGRQQLLLRRLAGNSPSASNHAMEALNQG
jgi:hypothetical protein